MRVVFVSASIVSGRIDASIERAVTFNGRTGVTSWSGANMVVGAILSVHPQSEAQRSRLTAVIRHGRADSHDGRVVLVGDRRDVNDVLQNLLRVKVLYRALCL